MQFAMHTLPCGRIAPAYDEQGPYLTHNFGIPRDIPRCRKPMRTCRIMPSAGNASPIKIVIDADHDLQQRALLPDPFQAEHGDRRDMKKRQPNAWCLVLGFDCGRKTFVHGELPVFVCRLHLDVKRTRVLADVRNVVTRAFAVHHHLERAAADRASQD
jgi:hypothetical protein